MNQRTVKIEGMSCGHCVRALEKELEKVSGLTVVSVKIGEATVSWDGNHTDEAALRAAVEEAGFRLAD